MPKRNPVPKQIPLRDQWPKTFRTLDGRIQSFNSVEEWRADVRKRRAQENPITTEA